MKQLINNPVSRRLFLLALIVSLATRSFATIHTVSVADVTFFSPSSFTAHVGDTVRWVWSSGTHTTTSTTIPSTATPWDQPINSTATSFQYKITALGTYNYQCTFHVSMGMVGSFTVVSATGVEQSNTTAGYSIFPNPASDVLNVQLSDPNAPASLTILDTKGVEVARSAEQPGQNASLNTANIPNGLYFMHIVQGQVVYNQKLTIMH